MIFTTHRSIDPDNELKRTTYVTSNEVGQPEG